MKIIEKQVINKALVDGGFGREVLSKIPSSSFEEESTKELVFMIKEFYDRNQSEKNIGMESLLSLVEDKSDRRNLSVEKRQELYSKARLAFDIPEDTNENVKNENITKFIRRELSLDAIKDALNKGNIEEEGIIEELSDRLRDISIMDTKGDTDGDSIDFFYDIQKKYDLYKNMKAETIPTGFSNLDKILRGGGIAKGELALLVAPSGTGKTSTAIQLASNSVRNGFNTLYITLEEKSSEMTYRFERNIGKVSSDYFEDMFGDIDPEVFKEAQINNLTAKENNNYGELFIEKRRPREVDITGLEQIIINWKLKKDKDIDVLVIDYPALMKIDGRRETHEELGILFEQIRGVAQKFDLACWTLAQTNRSAWAADIVSSANIEGSKKIINTAELVLVVNRTHEEYEENVFRLYIDKIRNPKEMIILPEFLYMKIDSSKGYNIEAQREEDIKRHKDLLEGDPNSYKPKDNNSGLLNRVGEMNEGLGAN